ncbi:unnamed protein product, partial [marine sediment metagenome]
IAYEAGSWEGYMEKLLSSTAAGMAPDVFWMGAEFVPDLAPLGALLPLTEYAEADPLWWDDYLRPAREDLTWRGDIYGIPQLLSGRAVVYRKDFFAEAGLDQEKGPDTWQDLIDYAVKLTKRDSTGRITRAGFDDDWGTGSPTQLWMHFVLQSGGQLFSTDELTKETKVRYNDAAGVRATEFYKGWFQTWKFSVAGAMPHLAGLSGLVLDTAAMSYMTYGVIMNAKMYKPEIEPKLGLWWDTRMSPFTPRAHQVFA